MENHLISTKCSIHQEIAFFYCLDPSCNQTVVCRKCVSSGKHFSHILVDQEDAELLIQASIKESLVECQEPLRSFWTQFIECKKRIQRSIKLIEHTLLQLLNPIAALRMIGLPTITTQSKDARITIELEQKLHGIAVDLEQICEKLENKREWKLESTFEGHEGVIYCSALSKDKLRMATGSGDMSVIVWDLKNQKLLAKAQNAHQGVVWCVAYSSAQGKEYLASGSDDNTIKTWTLIQNNNEFSLKQINCLNTNDAVFSLIYRNEQLIAGVNSVITIYDSEQMKEIKTMKGHKDYISTLDYQQNILISGSKDKNVMIWDLDSWESKCILEGHTNTIRCVCISGDLIASGGYDKQLRIWEWKQDNNQEKNGKLLHILEHQDVIWTLQQYFSQQNTLMSGCKDGKMRLWDMKSGEELERIECWKGVMSMQYLEEGRMMVCMSNTVCSYVVVI